jgi:hypothetical protein
MHIIYFNEYSRALKDGVFIQFVQVITDLQIISALRFQLEQLRVPLRRSASSSILNINQLLKQAVYL